MSSTSEEVLDEAGPPLFRIEELKKTYEMGEVTVPAIRDISLAIQQGEFLVVLGPSGSGKSTLLNIIGGMNTPTSGRASM